MPLCPRQRHNAPLRHAGREQEAPDGEMEGTDGGAVGHRRDRRCGDVRVRQPGIARQPRRQEGEDDGADILQEAP